MGAGISWASAVLIQLGKYVQDKKKDWTGSENPEMRDGLYTAFNLAVR